MDVDLSLVVKLESGFHKLDEILERLFRHLVKTTSTLVNVVLLVE